MWPRALLTLTIATCSLTVRADQASVSVFYLSSGRPVSEATVLLSREDGTDQEVDTDSEGRAVFWDLRPGAYWIRAEKPGYVDLLDPNGRGRPLVVSAANKNPIGIGLTQAGAISGQVLDGQGNPLQGANVYAIVRRGAGGAPRYIQFGNPGHTDDNGKYRLHGLPPGHYSVAVVPFGRISSFAPVYFPGSNSPGEAEFLELKPGETTSANLRVATAEARSISGKLSGLPADVSAGRAAVALITRDGLQVAMAGSAADADGSFVLRDVPPGEYLLIAWTPHAGWDRGGKTPGADARSAARSISVSGVDLETGLELQPLARVTGRLILDGATRTDYPCRGGKEIAFHSEDGWDNVWRLAVAVDGEGFRVEGLPAGRYRIAMPGLGDSCRLTSVRVGDREAPAGVMPIDGSARLTLVLATGTGAVSGAVTTQEAKPAVGIVVLSRTDGEGVAQVAQLDGEGRYGFSQVLAGEYRLTALDSLNSADYLESVEASKFGTKLVVVEAGQTETCDLRLIRQ